MGDYKHPEVLVSTDWVAAHADDPKVRLVEVDVDTTAYEKGHIKNAIAWNWTSQLQDNVRRDLLGQKQFEELCRNSGIPYNTTVVSFEMPEFLQNSSNCFLPSRARRTLS